MSEDIINRLENDFAADSQTALAMLVDFGSKNTFSECVTRCIIVLSKGNVEQLKKYIASAKADWRDVIFWQRNMFFNTTNHLKISFYPFLI